jgi:hypothetical protein
MKLDKKILDFLLPFKQLLKNEDWEEIYKELHLGVLNKRIEPEDVGQFTKWVLFKDRNPLDKLDYVPPYFLYKVEESIPLQFFIPEGIGTIHSEAFSYTHIRVLGIPKSMKTIQPTAFRGCEKLSKIVYPETKDEWRKISILSPAFKDCKRLEWLQCKEGVFSLVK